MNDNKIQKQVFEISALDMFSIGIGPSSSHTIGPMRAAFEFISILYNKGLLMQLETINIDLYGSLALTGEGHGTILAILNGLAANDPKTISADNFMLRSNAIINSKKLIINYANIIAKNNNQSTIDISDDILLQQSLRDYKQISFDIEKDVIFHKNKFLPEHSNAVCFTAFDSTKQQILFKKYFSISVLTFSN